MRKMIAVLLVGLCAISAGFAQAADNRLIPVFPSQQQPTYAPPPPTSDAEQLPSPRDQLYVFWVLGKVLSYPFDKVDSYIEHWKSRRKAQGQAVPASAPARSENPFDSVNWREIPPAPPTEGGFRTGR